MSDYFSDKELGQKDRISEEISLEVWNGVVTVYNELAANNAFTAAFPATCEFGKTYTFSSKLFNDRVKAEIPTIETPINNDSISNPTVFLGEEVEIDKRHAYSALDFIQFCHNNITQVTKGEKCDCSEYNDMPIHYELIFKQSDELRKDYRDKINTIFERNSVVFFIKDDGQINRVIPKSIEPLINQIYSTEDIILNKLVRLAHEKFVLPRTEDRIYALEKIWDAFERVKTYYDENKKVSDEQLVEWVANKNSEIKELINAEAKALTDVGNKFHIRHFEKGKIEITDNKHIDYLFYRMVSLIHLFLSSLESH